MKKFLGLMALAGAAAAVIAYRARERMLPAPATSYEPPPRFRTGGDKAAAAVEDLTELKGIGPTYAARLEEMSILTRSDLVAADPQSVADGVGTSVSTVEGWQAAAAQ